MNATRKEVMSSIDYRFAPNGGDRKTSKIINFNVLEVKWRKFVFNYISLIYAGWHNNFTAEQQFFQSTCYYQQQPDSTSSLLTRTSPHFHGLGNTDSPEYPTSTSLAIIGQNSSNSSASLQPKRGCIQLWQ